MAVMAREAWTDERLDDLRENVNQRFDDVDRRFDQVDRRFDQVDKRFEQVDKRFEQVDKRLDAMQADMKHGFESMYRTMIIGFVTLFASIVASVLGAALLG
jgi:DNA anti-recombination protein RmuC